VTAGAAAEQQRNGEELKSPRTRAPGPLSHQRPHRYHCRAKDRADASYSAEPM
jgi:hypothetical protein